MELLKAFKRLVNPRIRLSMLALLCCVGELEASPEEPQEKDELSTKIDVQAQITQLWTNDHPAKIFECWGRAPQVETSSKSLKESSEEQKGSFKLSHENSTQPFTDFTPVVGSWDSKLSDDRVLSLSFNQKINENQTTYRHQACSTEKFYSQMDAVSTRFNSNASLYVPADVYLLRVKAAKIKELSTAPQRIEAKVYRAARLQEGSSLKDESFSSDEGLRLEDNIQYFFVRPKDRIDFTVSWSGSSHSDASFEVVYEIEMIGQDHCETDLWDLNSNRKPRLTEIVKLFDLQNSSIDPHRTISRMSCLRSSSYLGSLLYSHHASDLVRFLSELNQAFQQRQEQVHDDAQPFLRELSIATSMTLFDISRTILADIGQYCNARPVVLTAAGGEQVFGYINGFHYAARHWNRIRLLFEQAENGLLPLFESFLAFMYKAEQKGLSFKEFKSDTTDLIFQHIFISIFGNPFRTLSIVEHLINDLPQLQVNQGNREALTLELRKGVLSFESLELEFRTLVSNMAAGSSSPISAARFERKLKEYSKSLLLVRELTLDDSKWFQYDHKFFDSRTNRFRMELLPAYQDIQSLNERFVYEIGMFLTNYFGHKIGDPETIDFLRIDEMRALHKKVDQCLRSEGAPEDED